MSPPVIEVRNLTKTYGRVVAVDSLEFEVAPGTVTGFLGPNGAGKTTTMRSLLGLIRHDTGEVRVLGGAYRQLDQPLRKVGALIDGQGFHPGRTARAHLRSLTTMAGIAASRVEELLDLVDLTETADRRVGTYSLGMGQRLGLAAALIGEPELLVLDEPANGLDPAGMRWIRSLLRSYAESGRTVFVSSDVLSEVAHLVDEAVVIKQGRLVTHTSVKALIQEDRVLAATPETERLAQALERSGATVEILADQQLQVAGLTFRAGWEHCSDRRNHAHRTVPNQPNTRGCLPPAHRRRTTKCLICFAANSVKMLTTRTPLGIMVGAIVVVALGTASTIMSMEPGRLTGPIHDQMFYFLASISLGVFALILGVRGFTDEFRHGTMVSTFLIHTSRRRVVIAKTLVSALVAAARPSSPLR